MSTTYWFLLLLFPVSFFAQRVEDAKAIKSMCGCYEVQYSFAETFQYPKDTAQYIPSKIKHEYALEWAQLVEDSPEKIVLQHILIIGEDAIIKHWRQDWLFENTYFYTFNGFGEWKFHALSKEEVRGQWTQKVYQVDDSPRYEGTASWVHVDGRHFWENTTYAPLPRREHTKRNDYNIMKRTNVHEIVKNGWIHDQDNDKIIIDNTGNEYLLAQEKGINTYIKVEDNKCTAAQQWWLENRGLWSKVRQRWDEEFKKNNDIKLKEKVGDRRLHNYLFELSPNASQEEVNKVMNRFISN